MPKSFSALTLKGAGHDESRAKTSGPLTLSWWIGGTTRHEGFVEKKDRVRQIL